LIIRFFVNIKINNIYWKLIAKAVNKYSIVLFEPNYIEYFGLENNINIRTKKDICDPCCNKNGWY